MNDFMVMGVDVKSKRDALIAHVERNIKTYSNLEEAIQNLIEPTTGVGNETILLLKESKCYTFLIERRGLTYIVGLNSSIVGTHGNQTMSYHLIKDDTPTNVEDNPNGVITLHLRTLEESVLLKPS